MGVSERLIHEIDEKYDLIGEDPEYYLKRAKRIKQDLRRLARTHSFWLEHPKERSQFLNARGPKAERIKRNVRKRQRRIVEAWKYLDAVNGTGELAELTNPSMILEVAAKIEPIKNDCGFRQTGTHTSVGSRDYVPPNPRKVPQLLEEFYKRARTGNFHSVELAAMTHLNIAAIHPFNDGNGRTARLIQDRILYDAGLPPALIPSGEREAYIDLIEQASIGLREHDTEKQRPFFNYVAGKVNGALDKILGGIND